MFGNWTKILVLLGFSGAVNIQNFVVMVIVTKKKNLNNDFVKNAQ